MKERREQYGRRLWKWPKCTKQNTTRGSTALLWEWTSLMVQWVWHGLLPTVSLLFSSLHRVLCSSMIYFLFFKTYEELRKNVNSSCNPTSQKGEDDSEAYGWWHSHRKVMWLLCCIGYDRVTCSSFPSLGRCEKLMPLWVECRETWHLFPKNALILWWFHSCI